MKTDRARASIARLVGATLTFIASAASAEEPLKLADSQLEPINWTELAGWLRDDHLAAFAAYQASCQALHKIRHSGDDGAVRSALRAICRRAVARALQRRRIMAVSSLYVGIADQLKGQD